MVKEMKSRHCITCLWEMVKALFIRLRYQSQRLCLLFLEAPPLSLALPVHILQLLHPQHPPYHKGTHHPDFTYGETGDETLRPLASGFMIRVL